MPRKNRTNTKGVVYLISFPNKKKYVGITTTSLKERKQSHISHKNTSNLPVHNAIAKYGKEVEWKIIDKANNWDDLCKLEIKYINIFKSHIDEKGYNLTTGGDGTVGYKHSKESNKENSVRRQIYFSNYENRLKQSQANQKAYQANPSLGKEHSQSMKKYFESNNNRLSRKKEMEEYLSSEVNLIKHSIQRGAKKFKVYDSDGKLVGEWLTQSQCARDLGLMVSHINSCLHGRRKTHGGFKFKFK
jgi:group I intron endonuclease